MKYFVPELCEKALFFVTKQGCSSSCIKAGYFFVNAQNTNGLGSLPKSFLIHLLYITEFHVSPPSIIRTTPLGQFDMWFGGSTSMPSPQNNTWIPLGIFPRSLFVALLNCWRARGTLFLHQHPILSDNSLTATPGSRLARCLCSIQRMQATEHSKWRALCFVLVGLFY